MRKPSPLPTVCGSTFLAPTDVNAIAKRNPHAAYARPMDTRMSATRSAILSVDWKDSAVDMRRFWLRQEKSKLRNTFGLEPL